MCRCYMAWLDFLWLLVARMCSLWLGLVGIDMVGLGLGVIGVFWIGVMCLGCEWHCLPNTDLTWVVFPSGRANRVWDTVGKGIMLVTLKVVTP
jgi:hypothetical protein